MGISNHSDNDFLTVLLQDHIGGLQVLHDNQWYDVPPVPGALVVNIGDLLQAKRDQWNQCAYCSNSLYNNLGPPLKRKEFNPILLREDGAGFSNHTTTSPTPHNPLAE
ncbi:1-aminocyclopropane-1-carboxylate oxidase-1-like protein [Morus notabilis]|uniref:1-aminocyclopropane-1-carboxylate oxidase-1-like protein n=1 Tax=Morus notabilis TaxID=981085 RepID=W9RB48_9ROSA|nr:1-aminocyclopropane-1-carboxylate oxidase-1-like protein [Morus notabilis]